MNRSQARRRKAMAKRVRENRMLIKSILASGNTKVLHRFVHQDGVTTGINVHYSDEESE